MSEITSETKKANSFSASTFEAAYNRLLKERPGILASEMGGELDWLREARERDFGRWCAQGLPTKRNEKWSYTNVAPLAEAEIVPAPEVSALPARGSLVALKGESEADIVFVNGHYAPELSKLKRENGVSVVVLSKLFEECVNDGWTKERIDHFSNFRKHVETSDADRETVFAAMNTSFMQDGVLVSVEKNIRLTKPIVVAYVSTLRANGSAKALPMVSPRVFVHLAQNAEAALLEVYEGSGDHASFTNAVSDVRLEEGARLSYCKVQLEGENSFHIGTTRIHQKSSSFSEAFQFSFGAKLSRQDLHISLEGQGAEAALDGLYMVSGKQHVDNHTAVEHVVPNTSSSQVYKGILDGEARAVFNGFVRIHKDAQKSNAAQLNNNLMLSLKSEVDTKPELEIDADDVKAAHGATIGRIDPEHVFYLETRAIPRVEAVRLLARGFAQDVVFRIRNESLRHRIGQIVDARFDQMHVAEKESLISQ